MRRLLWAFAVRILTKDFLMFTLYGPVIHSSRLSILCCNDLKLIRKLIPLFVLTCWPSYFSQKIGFDISCRLSPKERNCMKWQNIFYWKKNAIHLSSAEFTQTVVMVILLKVQQIHFIMLQPFEEWCKGHIVLPLSVRPSVSVCVRVRDGVSN